MAEAKRVRSKRGLSTSNAGHPEYPDNMTPTEMHDLMVSAKFGRTTFIQPRPSTAIINISKRCKELWDRLTSAFPEGKKVSEDKLTALLEVLRDV